MKNRQFHDDESRSVLLFPIALLHSHLYWFCSVIWTVCKNFSTEPIEEQQPQQQQKSINNKSIRHNVTTLNNYKKSTSYPMTKSTINLRQTANTSLTVTSRPRGFSAPPPPSSVHPSTATRERCTTISAGAPIEPSATSRRRRFPISLRPHHSETEEEIIIRPSPSDERTGTTCPPQWWQKTRFYIDALKHSSSPNSSVCSLSDGGDVTDETNRYPRKSAESAESAPVITNSPTPASPSTTAIPISSAAAAAGNNTPTSIVVEQHQQQQWKKRFRLKSFQKQSSSEPTSPEKQQQQTKGTGSMRMLFRKKTTTL